MFIDPIIMQLPEGIDAERFVIATYYCAAKPTTNMVKFAAALAIEQTCGTWLKVPGETPEVRERAIGRVVGVYEAPAYQIGIPSDVKERQFIVRIAYPWQNFGTQFSMMLSTVIGNISSSGKVKLIDLEFPSSFLKGFKGPKFGVEGIRDLSIIQCTLEKEVKKMNKRKSKTTAQKYINFVEALAIYLLVAYFPLPSSILTIETAVLTASGRVALGVLFACLFLWITEPVPFHITGFLGVLLMLLLKVDSFATLIKQGFGSETIVFFIGVLTLSAMITRSGLGKRISLFVLSLTGNQTAKILLGFLVTGTVLSMWITELAVAAILAPLAVSLLNDEDMCPMESNFGKALLIACAWGPIIGGIGTPAGAGPNQIAIGFLRDMAGTEISFLEWMKYGVPAALLLILPAWWILLKFFPPEKKTLNKSNQEMKAEFKAMPGLSHDEKSTVVIFLITVVLWVLSDPLGSLLGIKIPTAAPAALCIVLFFLPGVTTFGWREIEHEISWDSIILIATGVSLGLSVYNAGAAEWLALAMLRGIATMPAVVQIILIILIVSILKVGLSSNTVTASIIVPIIIALATTYNLPMMGIVIPACLTLALAFILVTSTPTSIIPYSYGYFTITDMAKPGTVLTLLSSGILTLVIYSIGLLSGIY